MATTTLSQDIIGLNSISFIRPQRLSLKLSNCRPGTKMYPFFDSQKIGDLITGTETIYNPSDRSINSYITVDSDGEWYGFFDIPPERFNTGAKVLKFQEGLDFFALETLPGVLECKAENTFTSFGLEATFQTTVSNILDTETLIQVPQTDPLAQSFFTSSTPNGCFITSIDVYFFQYDPNLPVRIEIREMDNGYPSNKIVRHGTASIPGSRFATIEPSTVTMLNDPNFSWPGISNNASKATTFRFSVPVYLKGNSEYCFVLFTDSNKYFVFTSEMGLKSFETNKTIFEQPFIGSMFKSANNSTWTADQTADIKFTMRNARFTASSALVDYNLYSPPFLLPCANLTTNATDTITVKLPIKHGMVAGDKFIIKGSYNSEYSVWNGVPIDKLTCSAASSSVGETEFTVNSIVDEFTFKYVTKNNTAATSTGVISHGGIINYIDILDPGTGYSNSSVFSFVGGTYSSGTTDPVLTPTIVDGKILSITVTNSATSKIWTTLPTISVTVGTSANLVPVQASEFIVIVPRQFQIMKSAIANITPPGTNIVQKIKTSDAETGAISSESEMSLTSLHYINGNAKLSTANPTFTDRKTQLALLLSTNDLNVSPVINLNVTPSVMFFDSKINWSEERLLTSTVGGSTWSGGIFTFHINGTHNLNVGDTAYVSKYVISTNLVASSNWNSIYTVESISTDRTYFTASRKDGSVTNPGTYILDAPESTTHEYRLLDSELLANLGNASARYISKIIKLDTVSSGVRIYVNAMSTTNTWFDVYFRTSLSSASTKHTDTNWLKLTCDEDRAASNTKTDFKDYIFYMNDISKFDVYDVKIVLRSKLKAEFPIVANYRSIVLAS